MAKINFKNLIGSLLLLSATIVWGSSFFILKATVDDLPVFFVLAIRFLISGLLLGLIFVKNIIKINKQEILHGIILGLVLTCAYAFQTYGLKYTTPSRNAFITAAYCVLIPFIAWIFFNRKPKLYNIIAAVLCIVGIGFVSLSGDKETGENLFLGDSLTLCCTIFYALQIIFSSIFQEKGSNTTNLLVVQLITVGVVCTIISCIVEIPVYNFKEVELQSDTIFSIIYLTFACTLYAQFAQIFGLKNTKVNQASVILSLESVFGVLFSVIFTSEKLTIMLIIGFVTVFIAILINELQIDILKIFKRK